MVPCAYGNSACVKHLPHVEVVDVFYREGYNADFVGGCPYQSNSLYLLQAFRCVMQQILFMGCNVLATNILDKLDGGLERDHIGNIGRSRFELIGQVVVSCLFERHVLNHLATPLIGRHFLEPRPLSVQNTGTGRTVHFMGRETVKVAVEIADVNFEVSSCLRAVNQYRSAGGARQTYDFLDRVDRTKAVGSMVGCYQPRARRERSAIHFHIKFAAPQNRDDRELSSRSLADKLPGNDVRVVLK